MIRRIGLGTLIATAACAGAKAPATTTVKPTASAAASGPAGAAGGATAPIVAGRAKLVPLISDGWQARDALDLGGGKTLYVGSSGQRWIAVEQKAPLPDDPENTRPVLAGAPSMAPEDLVAVRKRADGSFLFVGETGATYAAASALGDLTSRRAPPEPLRAVAAGKDAILGITQHDTLLRSIDGGATFASVAIKSEAVPTLLTANAKGEALVFFAPGRMYASFDDGASFRAVPNEGLGAASVFAAANGPLYVRGFTVSPTKPPGLAALASSTWVLAKAADGAPAFEKSKGGLSTVSRPMADEDRLELAEGVRNGHAVFDGLRYLEVRAAAEGEMLQAVTLEKGVITHHPSIAATKGTELLHVASGANTVELLCGKWLETKKGDREQLLLFKSTDFGKTFAADGVLESSDAQKRMLVSATGHVAVLGGCLQAGCSDEPLLVRPAGTKAFVAAKLPKAHHLSNTAPIRFGGGDRVYAIATHEEESGLFLLSSKDAGRTFTARALPHSEDVYIDDVQELAIDDKSGLVSVFSSADPIVRATTKDDGATWQVSELPFGAEWMSIVGARGLATSYTAHTGYETLDGGATWGVVPLPGAHGVGGTLPIACSEQGCMLGDVAIREGWELATAADVKGPPTKEAGKQKTPAHLPLVECKSDGAEIELGTAGEPIAEPSPSVAFATVVDDPKGAIDVVTWPRAGKTIARLPLLPAAKDPTASKRITSSDGVIVLRAPRNGDPKSVVDLELAWWLASTGKVHRATLAKAGTPAGKWGNINAVATIVPGHGVYVRIAGGTDAATHLARETGAVTKVTLPPNFPALQRMFARRIGAQTMFVGAPTESNTGERIASFALLSDKNEVKTFTWALWPRLPRGRTEVSTFGDQIVLTWPGTDEIAPRHFALALKDAGPEPPEPTAIPVAKGLPACDTKAAGARVELPFTHGSRTPIVVKHGTRTLYHATNITVTRAGKCASTLLAGAPGGLGSEWTVLDADGTRGFLFVRSKAHGVVPLTCSKSAAALPATFVTARGF